MWRTIRLLLRTHLRAMRVVISAFTVCWILLNVYIGYLVGHGHFSGEAPIRGAAGGEALGPFGAAVFLVLVFGGMAGFGILLWACVLHLIRRQIRFAEEHDEREHG